MFNLGDLVVLADGHSLFGIHPLGQKARRTHCYNTRIFTVISRNFDHYGVADEDGYIYNSCSESSFVPMLLTKEELKRINKLNNVRE